MPSSDPHELHYGEDGTLRDSDDREVTCSWFAHCFNGAVTIEHHPILGGVPICGRCLDFIHADDAPGRADNEEDA